MIKRGLIVVLIILCAPVALSQTYIDLVTASYNYSPPASFEFSDQNTNIHNADISLTLPVPLKKDVVLLPGLSTTVNQLSLDPDSNGSTGVFKVGLQLGVRIPYANNWSGLHYLIPRISSALNEYRSGFQIATIQLFEKQKSPNATYGFGIYASEESYGWMLVPLASFYLKDPEGRYELRIFFPSRGDVNYRLTDQLRLGLYFDSLGSTHDLQSPQFGSSYVQRISNDLQAYLRFDLTPSLLLAVRAGYAFFRSYRVYDSRDTAGVSIANFFFNDNRTPLNRTVGDGFLFGVRFIYRYNFSD